MCLRFCVFSHAHFRARHQYLVHTWCVADNSCAIAERFAADGVTETQVVFDVGCNKGYETANMFSLLAPSLQLTPSSLYQSYVHHGVNLEALCGTCRNCHDKSYNAIRPEFAAVQVHCFEPGSVNHHVSTAKSCVCHTAILSCHHIYIAKGSRRIQSTRAHLPPHILE